MATFEYTDIFDYPQASVFAVLTDLEGRLHLDKRHPGGPCHPCRTSSPGDQLLRGWQVLRLQEREDDARHRV